MLEHVLHKLLHTFALLGVHNLEHSVKVHWLRFREAEQLSPFLCYPKFVSLDVPLPQSESSRIRRQTQPFLALAQPSLTFCALLDDCREKHQRHGQDNEEQLDCERILFWRSSSERTVSVGRTPNSRKGHNPESGARPTRSELDRRPQ
jgi:hypothetical protein